MGKWSNILKRIDEFRWRLPKSYQDGMNTDGMVFADDRVMELIDQDEAIKQVANVACLPGIVGSSLAMPDIHWGYGFPVGGVAAFDVNDGVISPGGIGYDINCGVRLMKTDLELEDVKSRVGDIVRAFFSYVPSGVGRGGAIQLSARKDMDDVLKNGAEWAVKKGCGISDDLAHTEANGRLKDANPDKVSKQAKKRGSNQAGSLGAGNHFLEVQQVTEIYDEDAASAFGIEKGMITVMIHTGSRGLGHQVASDYIQAMGKALKKYDIKIPDRQLACAPVNSAEGKNYIGAMACAANFAWANRQIIAHRVREVFEKVFGQSADRLGIYQVYDVAHNIAKFEEYNIDGKKRKVCVHRKGATRAFGPGFAELPEDHRNVGQAVIIPGDMGRYSYLLAGNSRSAGLSFSSTCHGAGRVMSRSAARKALKGRDLSEELEKKGIFARGGSWKSLAEEAPEAYKDVVDVVNTAHGAGLARKVAKLKPLGVMKG